MTNFSATYFLNDSKVKRWKYGMEQRDIDPLKDNRISEHPGGFFLNKSLSATTTTLPKVLEHLKLF